MPECSKKKSQLLLSNGWAETFLQQRINTHEYKNCFKLCFLCGPCWVSYEVTSRTRGYNWSTLFLQEPGHPGWGSLKNRDNELCLWVPWDSDLRKTPLAMPGKNWKIYTRLLVREGAPHKQTWNCLKNNQRQNGKNCSRVPDECLIPRRTGRLTVGRNVTLTLIWLGDIITGTGPSSLGSLKWDSKTMFMSSTVHRS
jgi:hypothetical protein